ncbi:MAG: TolC family protein [Bacteroidetes bacterium]|nr:TolC family protein [Bacteroidota bacterium]
MTTFERWKLCYVSVMLLATATVAAQDQNYSLAALTDSAKKYMPSLMERQALLKAADAGITDIRHSFLPKLRFSEQVNIGSDNSLAGSYFTYGVTPSTSAGVRDENNLQPATGNIGVLYGEYELVNFGLNQAKIQNAKAYTGLQQADLQREEYLLESSVARLYFSLLKNQYRLTADQQNIDRYKELFTIIKALTSSGINAGADSSLAKAELSKTIISYNQTLGRVNQLKEQLSFLTGISANRLAIDTAGHNFIHSIVPSINYPMDSPNNPVINYYSRYRDIFNTTDKVIRKTYLPKILLSSSVWVRGSSIQFSDQYKSLSMGLGYQRFNYSAGIALTYDLFNSIYRKDKLRINNFQSQAADARLQQQQLLINSASRQADQALKTIEANILQLPVQLSSAEATYRQKLAQYRAGIISLVDLTNASFVLYRSQTDYIETISDWYLAQVDKAEATGYLPQFINSIN